MTDELNEHERAIIQLGRDRKLAHKSIFKHRHAQESPHFHYSIMDLWASQVQHALVMAFRGAGKSTLAEEAITLAACYREFNNCVILADTWTRAVERLQKIRNEIETNVYLEGLFGSLVGSTWTDDKLVLSSGCVIQALGRGQSLRGTKHLDWRPDLVFMDDVEDAESCASDEAIAKTMRWLMGEVIPATAPGYKMRINGTPLHPKSVLMQLAEDPGWDRKVFPIEALSQDGERVPSWPERFPLSEIDSKKAFYERFGLNKQYNQEFMCQAEDMAGKPFDRGMFRVEPIVKTWQATYAVYDPARTTNKSSSTTGKVVYSWLGSRLIVWDATGTFWKPDELVSDIFATATTYNPIAIYVEADGLNEWLMQPIRQEQARRSHFFPVLPAFAPKGKLDFIMQMQPFFKAHEVIFANKHLPDLETQLLNFPTGRIDVPNALAYAIRLRPGAPVYDGFGVANIIDELSQSPQSIPFLAVNATAQHTTGALIQIIDGGINVLSDWVREGDPGQALAGLVADARLVARNGRFQALALPQHFDRYDNVGLLAAGGRVPCEIRPGGQSINGRSELRKLMKEMRRGRPAVKVSSSATWTLNALAGGFCYMVDKRSGALSDLPQAGAYRTLMEGLEAVVALSNTSLVGDDERVYATTADGRKYLTTLGGQAEAIRPSKADWGSVLSARPRR